MSTFEKIQRYVEKYWKKTGTSPHPDESISLAVIQGLANNMDEVGRPLCPCVNYPDKKQELEENGRRWICACDEMKQYKFCHCLLFATPEGLPITEYLPEDHYARQAYGVVEDPTPDKGREGRVVELADTHDSKSCAARRGGSSPPSATDTQT